MDNIIKGLKLFSNMGLKSLEWKPISNSAALGKSSQYAKHPITKMELDNTPDYDIRIILDDINGKVGADKERTITLLSIPITIRPNLSSEEYL